MATKDNDNNWGIFLQHMQAMEQRLVAQILSVKSDVRRVESKVDLALVQIGNLDERLDDLEVVQMPRLKKAVGMK